MTASVTNVCLFSRDFATIPDQTVSSATIGRAMKNHTSMAARTIPSALNVRW
jgi:hypothetical protein